MRAFLKEPLVHFLIAGVLIFVIYGAAAPNESTSDAEVSDQLIQISARDIERLSSEFESTWRRPPTTEEAASLLNAYLNEEVLVREALKLGLENGDSVVRQRLRLKMEFLIEGSVMPADPGDEILQAYVQANPETFSVPARIAFQQVFLGDRPSADEIDAVLAALGAGGAPQELGQRTLLPLAVPLSPAQAINGTFGAAVFEALQSIPVGAWTGPVQTGYGVHVVRVTERTQAQLLAFEDVRARALQAWQEDQTQIRRVEEISRLRDGYQIELPEDGGV